MDETDVVTCFVRAGVEVLLLRRSEQVGSYAGQWGGVAGHVAPAGGGDRDPDAAARAEIREETGIDPAALELVRRGDPLPVEDADLDRRWVVHPYLFDSAGTPAVETDWETAEYEWVQPTAILERETVPALWETYRQVGPTVETVREDTDHGSAYLSLRAVEVLRDRAAAAVAAGSGAPDLAALARELLAARPSMVALRNRVNRTMARADADPASVSDSARAVLAAAAGADRAAAAAAADRVGGATVASLSRSGTVLDALRAGDPAAVLLAESRPGREGVGVAEALAGDCPVALAPDAALPGLVERADIALVGADAVLPDGSVLNKVGTYPLALAAARAGVPVYAATAADKVSPDAEVDVEIGDPAEVYGGDADVAVECPLFEATPGDLVDGIVTEEGTLDADGVRAVAERHRELTEWDE